MRREDLPEKFQFLILDETQTFRLYVERKEVGKKLLNSFLKKRDGVDFMGRPTEGFYLSDRNKEVGLLSQLYGGNAMFTLMNRYGVELTDDQKEKTKDTILYVLKYLDENDNCFDLNPVLDSDVNSELFVDRGNKYVGAMTWALSLFVSARVAQRKGVMDFTEKETEKIFKHIRTIVKFFVENVVGTEAQPLGWGYANGCTEPSLFFTYSVIEAFADFDDNVLGGVLNDDDTQALNRDEELLEYINSRNLDDEETLTDRFVNICFAIGDRAWEIYKDVLRTDCFSDRFDEHFTRIQKEEIFRSSRSSVLFNTLYVIFTLFYSYTNVRKSKTNPEESAEIINTMTLALQLIQNIYDELCARGRESIVDKHIIAFDQAHSEIKDFGKLLNEESIQASPFLPMFVKANNLIAYYILQFPQKQMSNFFDMMLLEQMNDKDAWLWDKRRFDILSTERYFEALADFFDYYDTYERTYAEKAKDEKEVRADVEKQITPTLEAKVKRRVETAHKREMNQVRKDIAKEYPIETLMNERMDQKIQERAMGILTESINSIIKYNEASQKDKEELEKEFTPEQKTFKDSIERLMMSYFADDIRIKSKSANEMDPTLLTAAVQDDMQKFMSAFVEFIAYNNAKLPEEKKLSMADVFKLITQKNQ